VPDHREQGLGGAPNGVGGELHGAVAGEDDRAADQCARRHPAAQLSGFGEPVEILDVVLELEFIRYYARLALDLVLNPRSSGVWQEIPGKEELNPIIEQFTLSACLEFHRSHHSSPYRGVNPRYLFPSSEAAFNPAYATRLGFTHLIGGTKSNDRVARRLEERVEREDRELYRRCMILAGRNETR